MIVNTTHSRNISSDINNYIDNSFMNRSAESEARGQSYNYNATDVLFVYDWNQLNDNFTVGLNGAATVTINSVIPGKSGDASITAVTPRPIVIELYSISWLLTLYGIIFLLAIIGNSLVILTLVQNKRMRTITNVFLLNLAVSDLFLGVFCMPFTLVGTILRNFIFGEVMCKLLPFLQGKHP